MKTMQSIISRISKHNFRRKWRKLNSHNQTFAVRRFDFDRVSVGNHTYGPLEVHTWGAPEERLEIGSFVSIAGGVKFMLGGNHRTDTLFTYPFKVKFLCERREAVSKGPIIIGDDVWLGTDVLVLSGSSVGRGAVIGAGSVVAGTIPPYAVAIGNPCKVIKYRFDRSVIDVLCEVDLSSLSLDSLLQNIDILYESVDSNNVEQILCKLRGKAFVQNE